ncbi:MAG: hypothetical protein HC900_04765 [Methylacidiphilales bacterium]|nr:hypothetical protein [Candidatus Methylacidiphilales bacterium]
MTTGTTLDYWYFHLPNFVLAALFYTLLGRVLLGIVVDADSKTTSGASSAASPTRWWR